MTAMDGGERLDEGPAALNSVLERPHADAPRASARGDLPAARRCRSRTPDAGDLARLRGGDGRAAVAAAFGDGRSPPEIAYAIGEVVHNSFRTRGVTLTSYELRRLVAELLAQRQRAAPVGDERPARAVRQRALGQDGVVDGRRAAAPPPAVADAVFAGPPSPSGDSDAARRSTDVVAKVRARLVGVIRSACRARP